MKLALITFLAGLLFAGGLAVYTKEDIVKDYGKMFTAKVAATGEQKVVKKSLKKLPDTHFLAELVNTNPRMVAYLAENATAIDETKLNELTADPAALDKFYVEALKKDSTFTNVFVELVAHYLASKKSEIKGVTLEKDTVTLDQLTGIASKFFHADAVRPDGNIGWKIGSGITGMAEMQEVKHPIAEAFCYTAVVENYPKAATGIQNDFNTGAAQVQGEQKVVAGSVADTTLVAVRKGVNAYMAKSESLKKVLQAEYDKKKAFLNFVVQ
ncbi:hypothetical protein GXP67_11145 [Rhodocytophaga rosea]|uniref:Uncharacterized protein n=1 Tax=Rhodocytophaga rosea TaxID=2704465 RepID=A0A6C0GGW1_9BACT|nr:hypothetical protein [Rhodocytophaga rosea]QHT67159.1 hypothetical protein GXP67_11145 [Rhodocytophaga rosea]